VGSDHAYSFLVQKAVEGDFKYFVGVEAMLEMAHIWEHLLHQAESEKLRMYTQGGDQVRVKMQDFQLMFHDHHRDEL